MAAWFWALTSVAIIRIAIVGVCQGYKTKDKPNAANETGHVAPKMSEKDDGVWVGRKIDTPPQGGRGDT